MIIRLSLKEIKARNTFLGNKKEKFRLNDSKITYY